MPRPVFTTNFGGRQTPLPEIPMVDPIDLHPSLALPQNRQHNRPAEATSDMLGAPYQMSLWFTDWTTIPARRHNRPKPELPYPARRPFQPIGGYQECNLCREAYGETCNECSRRMLSTSCPCACICTPEDMALTNAGEPDSSYFPWRHDGQQECAWDGIVVDEETEAERVVAIGIDETTREESEEMGNDFDYESDADSDNSRDRDYNPDIDGVDLEEVAALGLPLTTWERICIESGDRASEEIERQFPEINFFRTEELLNLTAESRTPLFGENSPVAVECRLCHRLIPEHLVDHGEYLDCDACGMPTSNQVWTATGMQWPEGNFADYCGCNCRCADEHLEDGYSTDRSDEISNEDGEDYHGTHGYHVDDTEHHEVASYSWRDLIPYYRNAQSRANQNDLLRGSFTRLRGLAEDYDLTRPVRSRYSESGLPLAFEARLRRLDAEVRDEWFDRESPRSQLTFTDEFVDRALSQTAPDRWTFYRGSMVLSRSQRLSDADTVAFEAYVEAREADADVSHAAVLEELEDEYDSTWERETVIFE